jgi:CheY-like chemotaxis protein
MTRSAPAIASTESPSPLRGVHATANAIAAATARLFVLTTRKDVPVAVLSELRGVLEDLARARDALRDLGQGLRSAAAPRAVRLREVWERVSGKLSEGGARVRIEGRDDPVVAPADPGLDVLLASVAATEAVGLSGRRGTTTVRFCREGSRVRMTLESAMPPFSPRELEQLLDPVCLRKPEGFGEGLAFGACRRIAESVGGTFSIGERDGRREYCLELPAAEPMSSMTPPGARLRCLVVDDDPRVLDSCSLLLDHLGHSVRGAPNGAQALAALQAESFDAILLDLHLGTEPQGATLLERLAREHPSALRATLLVTGDPGDRHGEALCRRFGIGLLAKPFGLDELRRALSAVSHSGQEGPKPRTRAPGRRARNEDPDRE